jgi:hypothetical protein
MLMPRDKEKQLYEWTTNENNEGLLYFVQLIHSMLYYGAAEPSRVISLDTYHRLEEIDRAWDEGAEAKWRHSSVTVMIDEFLDYAARDPVIAQFYAPEWKAIQPRIKSFSDRPVEAVEAVRYLRSILRPSYLRNCRDYIEISF